MQKEGLGKGGRGAPSVWKNRNRLPRDFHQKKSSKKAKGDREKILQPGKKSRKRPKEGNNHISPSNLKGGKDMEQKKRDKPGKCKRILSLKEFSEGKGNSRKREGGGSLPPREKIQKKIINIRNRRGSEKPTRYGKKRVQEKG